MPRQRPRLARQPWATSGLDDADSFGRTGMCKLTEAGKAVAVGGGAAENEETGSDVLPDQLIYID